MNNIKRYSQKAFGLLFVCTV